MILQANEIAFINSLEAQNKRHDILSKHQDSEARLHEIQVGHMTPLSRIHLTTVVRPLYLLLNWCFHHLNYLIIDLYCLYWDICYFFVEMFAFYTNPSCIRLYSDWLASPWALWSSNWLFVLSYFVHLKYTQLHDLIFICCLFCSPK